MLFIHQESCGKQGQSQLNIISFREFTFQIFQPSHSQRLISPCFLISYLSCLSLSSTDFVNQLKTKVEKKDLAQN